MQHKQPFTEAMDLEIIMLALAHFGGDLNMMVEALEKNPHHPLGSIPLDRIKTVAQWQNQHQQDLISLLPQRACEAVEDSLSMKKQMEESIMKDPDSIHSKVNKLLLYLHDDPFLLIDQLVMEQKQALPPLLKALKNKKFFDPLYPGFGHGLLYIIDAIKGIETAEVIEPLFEALLEQNNFLEDRLLEALASYEHATTERMLQILEKRPFSIQSSYAAKALSFLKTHEVALAAVDALCDPSIQKHPALTSYLIALLDAIEPEDRSSVLRQLLEETHLSDEHQKEIEIFC
ncbi:MAG: hypothetical protein KGQ54_01725 [Verrucomicrobia bacterium]|nr:hypothetical protein [Verrucomicrobiota bacterium]NDE63834.1 hypothetical protein [Chlamydiota bacterium]